jgi:hypothetical protein
VRGQRLTAASRASAHIAAILIAAAGASDAHPRMLLTSDAPLVAGGPATLRFRIEDPGAELAAGDTLEIRFPTCAPWPFTAWAAPQIDDPAAPGYVTVRGPARVDAVSSSPVAICRGMTLKLVTRHPKVIRVVASAPLPAGEAVEVIYGDPTNAGGVGRAQRFPEIAAQWKPALRKVAAAGDSPAGEISLPPLTLEVGRAAPLRLVLSGAPQAFAGDSFEVRAAALDTLGFPAASFPDGVELRAVHESGKVAGPWTPREPGADPCVRAARVALDPPGIWWLEASLPAASGEGAAPAPWALPIRIDAADSRAASPRRLAFGDLHWHSNRSDGSRSIREGYAYARDVVGLDFTAASEHDLHHTHECIEDEEWSDIEALANEMESRGKFAALPAWEYTSNAGHWVVLLRGAAGAYRPVSHFPEPEDLWGALVPGEAITIMAHPAGGSFVPHMITRVLDARFARASEIYSLHGCAESPVCPHRAGREGRVLERADPQSTVQEALARGNTLAFVASTDNHTATPGNPVRHTRRDIVAGAGLCAAWVDSLTREGVFDAIHRGDVYATTGPRIRVEAALDGAQLTGLVAAAGELESVEVIGVRRGGEVPFPTIHSAPARGRLARIQWTLPDSLRERLDSVYLRVAQKDEEMAWSSPIPIPKNP